MATFVFAIMCLYEIIRYSIFTLVSFNCIGQSKDHNIGFKVGVAISNVSASGEELSNVPFSNTSIVNSTFGILYRYMNEEHFGLIVEANYIQKGWRELVANNNEVFYDVSLDYISVPILAHGHIGKRNIRLFLNAGIFVAYLLNDDASINDESFADQIDYPYLENFRNDIDFGVRGGGGCEIVTKIGNFLIEGGYELGLNSVIDKDISQIPNIIQNNSTLLTVGYILPF